ncbi:HalD/BesD family halogenase [Candidatus Poriferisodalis sp.]|uniref:HalD/BesD family halogenase n=1 Tax=Candidatus Poriferisodalis sp. TaxID=3101277 RepID=UPI003C6EF01C
MGGAASETTADAPTEAPTQDASTGLSGLSDEQVEKLIDTARYPLGGRDAPPSDPGHATYWRAVRTARAGLRSDGCALLKEFVTAGAVRLLNDEIVATKPRTHFSTQVINPYFHTDVDPDFDTDHPVNTFTERSSGFIPGDAWPQVCAIDTLFRAPQMCQLLADCLEIDSLYCYDDPLAGLTANILDPGQQFPWHFDTNDFAVTVLVQPADEGGLFEFAPAVRSADDEGFETLAALQRGVRDGVHTLDLEPGDLQMFRGRYSLHRVTRVSATSQPRHAAIFAYTRQPGVIGRVERTRQLFGRVLPEHEEAEQSRVRDDDLLD